MATFHQIILFCLPQNRHELVAAVQVISAHLAAVAAVAVVAIAILSHEGLNMRDPIHADLLKHQHIRIILQDQILDVLRPAVHILIIDVVAQNIDLACILGVVHTGLGGGLGNGGGSGCRGGLGRGLGAAGKGQQHQSQSQNQQFFHNIHLIPSGSPS